MPERSSVLQRTQIGPEVTPGTAVPATKRLGATSITIQPEGNINRFGPVGSKFDTIAAIGKEWSSLGIEGYGSYPDLSYLLAGLIRNVTPAQQGGSAAYLWTFTPQAAAEDTVKTFTVEQGSTGAGSRATRAPYGLINGLKIAWSREGVQVTGDGMAQRIQDDVALSTSAAYTLTANASPPTAGTFTLTFLGQTTAAIQWNATPAQVQAALELLTTIGAGNVQVVATVAAGGGTLAVGNNVYTVTFKRALAAAPQTLTGTFTALTASGSISLASSVTGVAPALINPIPILGNQISVYMDDTSAGLGTTKLLRCFGGEWTYGNRFSSVWPVNAAIPSFDAHVEVKPEAMFSMKLAADDVGMALLTTMRAGTTKFVRWEAVGDIIASTFSYRARIDMALKVADVFKYEDADGIYQVGFNFAMNEDAGWTRAFEFSVTNAIVAL